VRGGKPPSKFEAEALARAQGRQKDRLAHGAAQVVAGRTFAGAAFVAQPNEITFTDFTVGHTHRTKVLLTNVSLSFNSFKVLPLPDHIIDFFEVSYEKPGRMSAGTSCVLHIAFTPQLNEDILAEVGPESR
jgi:hypothetical protein